MGYKDLRVRDFHSGSFNHCSLDQKGSLYTKKHRSHSHTVDIYSAPNTHTHTHDTHVDLLLQDTNSRM